MPKFWTAAAALALLVVSAPAANDPKPALTLADPAIRDQDDMCVCVHPTDPAKSTINWCQRNDTTAAAPSVVSFPWRHLPDQGCGRLAALAARKA